MSAEIHRRKICRLCGDTALSLVFNLTPTPPANAFVDAQQLTKSQPEYPLDLFFCEDCSHLQLLNIVDPELLFRDYVYVSGTSPSFVRHFEKYAADVAARFDLDAGDLAVDIGSNDGTLLGYFKEMYLHVLGIDPAKNIAAKASKNGIETWPVFFDAETVSKILEDKGPASVVTANNVFAHADDLAAIADGVRTLLAPNGVFLFEVSYLGDVFEKTLFDTIYHEHLSYHSVQPLIGFFAARNMQLFSVQRVPSHGGSIRCVVQLADGPHRADGSVEAFVRQERILKIDRVETWRGYGAKINALGEELRAILAEIKQQGKTIAGFGAPAKATTLMYHFDIDAGDIDFIADDSPLKQGLFTPGKNIPVVSASEIYVRNPDYIVILAWNFAAPIIADHAEFQNRGGHFIVPLPKLEVV